MTEIVLHPKTVELRRRRDQLRRRLAELVGRRIALLFDEIPALRSRYTELFGMLEREIEEKTLAMSQRRRMMELFSLKLQRGQELDEKTITLTLKAVYREFERLRGQVDRMAGRAAEPDEVGGRPAARRRSTGGLSGNDHVRIGTTTPESRLRENRIERKKLYRRLARRLHPDIVRDHDLLQRTYWDLTQKAYQRDDLDLLRTLLNVVESGPGVVRDGTFESTAEEIVRLIELVDREEKRVIEIETTEPYVTRAKLFDEAWAEARQEELRRKIAGIEKETAICDEFLAPILSRGGERVTPESVASIWSDFVEDVYLSGRF